MRFDRFLGESKGKRELQTFRDCYYRWTPFVNLLGLAMLFITLPALGQGGATQTTTLLLTNAFPPGVGEGLARTFTDIALYGKASQDWLGYFKKVSSAAALGVGTDYSKPPTTPGPALTTSAYIRALPRSGYTEHPGL